MSTQSPVLHSINSTMKIVLQRVTRASVRVNDVMISSITKGLVVLVCVEAQDTVEDLEKCSRRVVKCKCWPHPETKKPWSRDVQSQDLEILSISQFALSGTMGEKNKLQFTSSMAPAQAKVLYGQWIELLGKAYRPEKVFDGEFGSSMELSLVNDGPVTITLDSKTLT